MKSKLIALCCAAILSIGLIFAQGKTSNTPHQDQHLLDNYTVEFHYDNGAGLHMAFHEGKAEYRWISGPKKGSGNKDISYRSTKIGDDMYLINWHETGRKDYLTIVFDFKNMVSYNSIIVGYENRPERTLKTVFKNTTIDYLDRGK